MSRIYRLKLTLLNKKDTKIIRHMITHVVVLLIMIFGIIHLSGRENYARQFQQINEYINELSGFDRIRFVNSKGESFTSD